MAGPQSPALREYAELIEQLRSLHTATGEMLEAWAAGEMAGDELNAATRFAIEAGKVRAQLAAWRQAYLMPAASPTDLRARTGGR